MIIIDKVAQIKSLITEKKNKKLSIGFVPTMGALHQGHLSLIHRAKRECDIVVASIFVNPTQFNDPKDYEKYPRTLDSDCTMLENEGCHILFAPIKDEMYQNVDLEVEPIDLGFLDQTLEGTMRPGHYQGVVTIVEKLFKAVLPDKVYMGLKDYQQVMVIKKLVAMRDLPIEIVGCPTLREPDGLAMSSRNMRLSPEERVFSLQISKALYHIIQNKNQKNPEIILEETIKLFFDHPIFRLEYLELRNAEDLTEISLSSWNHEMKYVVLIAVFVGEIRLIDNMTF